MEVRPDASNDGVNQVTSFFLGPLDSGSTSTALDPLTRIEY